MTLQLNRNNLYIPGSLGSFSAPISCALVGFLIDRLGRRAVLIYSVATSVIGWSLLLWNANPTVILLGQMFNGLTTGATGYASQVYAGECVMVNHVRLRNSFLMWNGVGGSIGSTMTLFLANFIDYRQICAICTLLSITLLILLHRVIPESPTWLYHKGRLGDAEWSARKLRIAQPILTLDPLNVPMVRMSSRVNWVTMKSEVRKFSRRDVYKPILIFIGINVLLATSGPAVLLTYMINIIQNDVPGSTDSPVIENPPNFPVQYVPFYAWPPRPHSPVDMLNSSMEKTPASTAYVPSEANMYSVIIGIMMCITSLTSCCIIPYFGIRNILSTSSFCSSFAFAILAFTTTYDSTPEVLKWRVVAISMVAVLYSLSCGSSDAILGDVLPTDAKGFASIVSVCSFLTAAFIIKAFPYMYTLIGGHVFLLFSIMCILAVYFIRTFMPEVLGKTLDQISREFLKV